MTNIDCKSPENERSLFIGAQFKTRLNDHMTAGAWITVDDRTNTVSALPRPASGDEKDI